MANHLTFGIEFIDDLLEGGLRPGDNVLLRAEQGTPVRTLQEGFVGVEGTHRFLVDVTGGWLDRHRPDVAVLDWRRLLQPDVPSSPEHLPAPPDPDLDSLVRQLADVGADAGAGTYWMFDSLTAMQHGLGPSDTLALVLIVCPRLYQQRSVALMTLDPGEHDRAFMDRVQSTVQVVLDLRRAPAGSELEVTKADGRPAGTVGRRAVFRVLDGDLEVDPISSGLQRLGEQLRAERRRRGMSQADLGRLVGISASAISQFERGVSGVSGHVLTRIWQALEVPFGPGDDRRRGFHVIRRAEMAKTNMADGVTGTLLFDDPDVGVGWDLTIAPDASRRQPMFAVKSTEVILVQRGVFDVVVAGEHQTLTEGDSMVTTRQAITSWRNPARRPTHLLWFVLYRQAGT